MNENQKERAKETRDRRQSELLQRSEARKSALRAAQRILENESSTKQEILETLTLLKELLGGGRTF